MCEVVMLILVTFFSFAVIIKALKQKYFSNRPGPTPGDLLPRPNCAAEAVKEQQHTLLNLKRKRPEGIEQGKFLMFHLF